MELWKYVLRCDWETDLTDPVKGMGFAYIRAGGMLVEGLDGAVRAVPGALPEGWFQVWTRNVHALRSLAGRLTREKNIRPASIEPLEADDVLDSHLAGVTASVRRVPTKPDDRKRSRRGRAPAPIPAGPKAFAEAIREPSIPLTRDTFGGVRVRGASSDPATAYWQDVFLSLVADQFTPPVCGYCGMQLPKTKKGRPSRSQYCKTCRFRVWRGDKPRETMKKKWREQQAAYRKRKAGGAKPAKG